VNEIKHAQTDHPVHDLITSRWSPYVFAERSVSADDLCCLFEAARWAASAFNEQPWRYLVATQENNDEFARLLSCLVESNQAWARQAPVLVLGVVSRQYAHNNKPNRTAAHDLGLASAQLTLEAGARGLSVHQMAGILPDRARELYAIPDGFDPFTALAIGYAGSDKDADSGLRERDATARNRRPLAQTVFGGRWDQPGLSG